VPATLRPAAVALLLAQIAHVIASFFGTANADAPSSEGVVGLPLGLSAIVVNVVVVVALGRGRSWAPRLASLLGFAVAVGFIVYHGLPFHSWATNPYLGTGANVMDWLGVAVCVVAGFWCAWAGFPRRVAATA
jgi:phosphatidylserine synthase